MNNPLRTTIVRVLIYILNYGIALIPVALAGFITVNPTAGTLTIDIEAAVGAGLAGAAAAGGIYAWFGKK